jgi:hypothetical protein
MKFALNFLFWTYFTDKSNRGGKMEVWLFLLMIILLFEALNVPII